jgi:hypothetical protein
VALWAVVVVYMLPLGVVGLALHVVGIPIMGDTEPSSPYQQLRLPFDRP